MISKMDKIRKHDLTLSTFSIGYIYVKIYGVYAGVWVSTTTSNCIFKTQGSSSLVVRKKQ